MPARIRHFARVFPDFDPHSKWKIALPSLFRRDTIPGLLRRCAIGRRDDLSAAHAARRLSGSRGRDEFQAACSEDDGILSCRPASLRRGRHTESARIRPGFFVKLGTARPTSSRSPIYTNRKSTSWPNTWVSRRKSVRRTPTTDTYSLEQTQEEFFFSLPYDQMDACLYGVNHEIRCRGRSPAAIGRTPEQVERVYQDIEAKRRAAHYLHAAAMLVVERSHHAPHDIVGR